MPNSSDVQFALSASNFVPNKFVNMVANDKDAITSLQQMFTDFTRTTELSQNNIIKILSINHTKIMNAARDAIQIEQDIKELQSLLNEQSKLILEMSSMNQPRNLTDPPTGTMSTNKYNRTLSTKSADDMIQIEELILTLHTCIIERKYHEVAPLIASIQRLLLNYDPTVQFTYNKKLSELVYTVCYRISNQLSNLNELLLSGEFSTDSLISIMISLNQPDLAADLYLQLAKNKLVKDLARNNIIGNENISQAFQVLSRSFIEHLIHSQHFILSKFSQNHIKLMFNFWAIDRVHDLCHQIIVDASSQGIHFITLCPPLKEMVETLTKFSSQLEVDFCSILKTLFSHNFETHLSLTFRHFANETKILFKNDPFKWQEMSTLSRSHFEFISQNDSEDLNKNTSLSLSVIYVYYAMRKLMYLCVGIFTKKVYNKMIEFYLNSSLKYMSNASKTLSPENIQFYNENVVFLKDKIIKYFEKTFPKSNFTESHSELIDKLAK